MEVNIYILNVEIPVFLTYLTHRMLAARYRISLKNTSLAIPREEKKKNTDIGGSPVSVQSGHRMLETTANPAKCTELLYSSSFLYFQI